MRRIICAVAALFILASYSEQARSEPIVVTDLLRLRSISTIDVARGGAVAVMAVRSIQTVPAGADDPWAPPRTATESEEPRYRNQSHLYLLQLDKEENRPPRQLTFGDRNDHSPCLSQDGRYVAFVREPAEPVQTGGDRPREKPQVWVIPVDGGEPQQLTRFKHGAGSPHFAPHGSSVLVTSRIPVDEIEGVPAWPMERPGRNWKDVSLPAGQFPRPDGNREEIRAWLDRNARSDHPGMKVSPVVITRLDFQDEQAIRETLSFDQLFIVEFAVGVSPHLDGRRISSSFCDHQDATFMPDGQSVVYAAKKPTDRHIDRVLETALYRVNIDGSDDRALLALDGWSLSKPQPHPGSGVLAFKGQKMDEPAFRQACLGMASMNIERAQDPVWLTDEENFDASVGEFHWMESQAAIVFNAAMQGGFPLMTISSGLVKPAKLVSESEGRPVGVHAFGVGGGAIVYSACSAEHPCVLKVRDGFGEREVWDLNEWVASKTISIPEAGSVTRPDGTRVQYWLMEPTNRVPGMKYPLVLEMHGGPSAMWGPGEFSMWMEFQLLCNWGYAVVYSNPRGSGGYGYSFQKGNFQDWGDGPAGDVLAVVDQAALKEWVDQSKLVITGGSYAGYLTAWIISHDNRFKAAVAQRGVYDLRTFFGEGNAWRLVQWSMGGNPYEARVEKVIDRNSPFTHVNRIHTPLLIMHASNDLRAGVSQSEMLYRALKELGRPVEYVRYPDAGHELSRTGDPKQRMDRLNRIIEFFERHIANERPAPVAGQRLPQPAKK